MRDFWCGRILCGHAVVPAGAYVIAADGGLDHTRQLGIVPDVVVGDFDSLEGRPPRTDVRTIALPALKDDPDMLSALKVGWSAGCREFHVYGGLGGRIDHTISGHSTDGIIGPGHGASGYLYGDGPHPSRPSPMVGFRSPRIRCPRTAAWCLRSPTPMFRLA